MVKRIVFGVAAAAILIALLIVHGWVLIGFTVAAGLIMTYEILRTIRAGGENPVCSVAFVFAALSMPACYFGGLSWTMYLLAFCICAIFVVCVFSKKHSAESIMPSMLALCYPQLFLIFMYLMEMTTPRDISILMLLTAFAASVFTDSLAYFTGRAMGRRKLCPEISPKKTVEGAAGGLVGGAAGVFLAGLIFGSGRFSLLIYIPLGIVLSAFSQIGDLSASMIKRYCGVKDYGNLIPGHGGLMDRLDSVLFIMPFTYLFFEIMLGGLTHI